MKTEIVESIVNGAMKELMHMKSFDTISRILYEAVVNKLIQNDVKYEVYYRNRRYYIYIKR